jgi:hypothetical protein
MHCKDALELFSDYVAGHLDRALTVSLENHIASCGDCRAEVASLRRVWTTLDRMPTVEPPPFFHENLMSRIAQETALSEEAARKRAPWDWRALFRPRALALAASAVVLLGASMEVVHTQHAALDPIGALLHYFRPAPNELNPLQKSEAVWIPETHGGKLVVSLQSAVDPKIPHNRTLFKLSLEGNSAADQQGEINSDRPTPIEVSLPEPPPQRVIRITLTPMEGDQGPQTVSIPIRREISPRTPDR